MKRFKNKADKKQPNNIKTMKRKAFLHRMAQAGGAIVLLPSLSILNSCRYSPTTRTALSIEDLPLLDEIGETIIPASNGIPGAKQAKIGTYMMIMFNDCYDRKTQAEFLRGLNAIDALCAKEYSNSFLNLRADQKKELLDHIHSESIAYNLDKQKENLSKSHYFDLLKGLTISGYFSSEIGMTKARKFLPIPGKYESCIPYKKDTRPWAS